MKSKWIGLARTLIVIFLLILFANALSLFLEVKRDISYYNRAYGLSTMDDDFESGEYYQIYINTIKNAIADEDPAVDTSQYEAFGRLFDAYIDARVHEDNAEYLKKMEVEKQNITWDKILTVIESLENDIRNR
ncbi:MAG: hypothetical protein IKX97_07700 [Erysipelotrichaceae bacterium]|nr:hypothetical protein [Erysipelotrichaceae bacterium]